MSVLRDATKLNERNLSYRDRVVADKLLKEWRRKYATKLKGLNAAQFIRKLRDRR